MDRLTFPYRSPTHLPFLHVVAESGSWEKYGLEVEYDRMITSSDAHDAVARGDVDFVGGNHVSTYGRRARGDDWVYLGQTMNKVPGWKLAVRPDSGITSVADLRKKRVASQGKHPGLNDWLYLKQHGLDVDRDDVDLFNISKLDAEKLREVGDPPKLWKLVHGRLADACFLTPPATVEASRAGLKLIDLDLMPMIFFTTISSGTKFVDKHPELVERFLKGMIEGIRFYKSHPDRAIEIILKRYHKEGALDAEAARATYLAIADALEPKLYPSPLAIANVYEEGIRQDSDARKMQPMELWDLHILRRLEDSGFMRDVAQPAPAVAARS
jgi:ABC-type nitrate/sulfonate/bicarbonate transport system substrate-binding protein